MPEVSHMPPKVERHGDVTIITFTYDPVRNLEDVLGRELQGLTDDLHRTHLLLDFSNVDRITSIELGTLVLLHRRMKQFGGRLTLFNLNPDVFEVFVATRLETLIDICR